MSLVPGLCSAELRRRRHARDALPTRHDARREAHGPRPIVCSLRCHVRTATAAWRDRTPWWGNSSKGGRTTVLRWRATKGPCTRGTHPACPARAPCSIRLCRAVVLCVVPGHNKSASAREIVAAVAISVVVPPHWALGSPLPLGVPHQGRRHAGRQHPAERAVQWNVSARGRVHLVGEQWILHAGSGHVRRAAELY